ncbi:MAG: radical SAM protein [Bacillota bacterium]|nr:radical SAM protein [Bacillota bacterium]
MIRVSAGSAAVLGLKRSKLDAAPTTAYLMCGTKCSRACAFCAQGTASSSRADLLSRVTWPDFPVEEAACAIAEAYREGLIKRACIQVVMSPGFVARTQAIVHAVKACCDIPLCVSVSGGEQVVRAMFEAGADRVSVPLDAASEEVYARCKGPGWSAALALIRAAARDYPGRMGTHLIAGLGETDEALIQMFQTMHDLQVVVGLFSFTPVKGTPLEHEKPPPLPRYRAIQAARWLVVEGLAQAENMKFVNGRLVSFGIEDGLLRERLSDGRAFQTSGCSDCNRPYYNERPGGLVYNYPRPLQPSEIEEAIGQALSWFDTSAAEDDDS